MTRNRSISSIIGNKSAKQPSRLRSTRKRDNKVPYYCNQCNRKLVLNWTKLFHETLTPIHEDSSAVDPNLDELLLDTRLPAETGSPALEIEATNNSSDSPALGIEAADDSSPNLLSIPQRHPRRYISHPQVTDDTKEQHTESSLSEDNKR